MAILHDDEFGDITLRRTRGARAIKISVAPDGSLRASMPLYAPIFSVKRFVRTAREQLRALREEQTSHTRYYDGMQIGKSHSLIVRPNAGTLAVEKHGLHIHVTLPHSATLDDIIVKDALRPVVIRALRLEAKHHLSRRLNYFATTLGYSYQRVRFSHASGRWGSCSSTGTISLNIALMKLPFELIDYVIIHELSHTKQMNHSPSFWRLVENGDPQYKLHRSALKHETPSL